MNDKTMKHKDKTMRHQRALKNDKKNEAFIIPQRECYDFFPPLKKKTTRFTYVWYKM